LVLDDILNPYSIDCHFLLKGSSVIIYHGF